MDNRSVCAECGFIYGEEYAKKCACKKERESTSMEKKDTNPKDAVGTKKVSISVIPAEVIAEIGLGQLEGARKYARHNYREAGVRASVYYDAVFRHLMAWWEGEDIDPDSGLNHVVKAICCLIVLRDSMINENWVDDRPPKLKSGWIQELNKKAEEIIKKYPNALEPYTELRKNEKTISDKHT